jgi:glycosyltransferase involved in cell wall biosynthesis
MTRLLIVTTISRTLQAFMLPYAEHFRAKGWRVDAMASGASTCPDCVRSFDRLWESSWSTKLHDPRNVLVAPREVREAVRCGEYDLVHVHTPVAAFVTRYALRKWRWRGRPKVIYTAHGFHFHQGGDWPSNALFVLLEKMAGRWTDYLVVINHEDERAATRHRLVSPDHLHYMPGIGLDRQCYHPSTVTEAEVGGVRRGLGLAKDDRLFLVVADTTARKGHVDAAHALARLNRQHSHLAFAGSERDVRAADRVRDAVRKLGLEDRVHFLGFRRDCPALMRASVAVLLPSRREGLPRSVMEALCMEVPVIGTDIRGTRELLCDGAGILVRAGDVEGLTEAMAWVLDEPEAAREMAVVGRGRTAAYDLRHVVRLHEKLYREALEG